MGFLTDELNENNKLYSEIQFVLSDIGDWIPANKLNDRRYVRFLPVLEEYKKLIEEAKYNLEKKNIFSKLFNSEEGIQIVKDYKNNNEKALNEIKNCTKCECFKCSLECKMKGCNQCQEGVGCRIGACKNDAEEPYSVYIYKNKVIELYNEDFDENMDYKILGMVYDVTYDIFYVIVERIGAEAGEDRKILSYRPENPVDDRYHTVIDNGDINFAIDAFEEAYLE